MIPNGLWQPSNYLKTVIPVFVMIFITPYDSFHEDVYATGVKVREKVNATPIYFYPSKIKTITCYPKIILRWILNVF